MERIVEHIVERIVERIMELKVEPNVERKIICEKKSRKHNSLFFPRKLAKNYNLTRARRTVILYVISCNSSKNADKLHRTNQQNCNFL